MSDRSDYEIQTNTQRISGINEETETGKTGRPFSFECKTNITAGSFFNTGKSYLDLDATGKCSGLMSAHNSELRLPSTQFGSQGHYTCHEYELVCQASTTIGAPVCMQWFQVSGDSTALADWLDTGFFWELTGFSEGTGNIYSEGAGALTTKGTLRINVNGVTHYIMLSSNEAN